MQDRNANLIDGPDYKDEHDEFPLRNGTEPIEPGSNENAIVDQFLFSTSFDLILIKPLRSFNESNQGTDTKTNPFEKDNSEWKCFSGQRHEVTKHKH